MVRVRTLRGMVVITRLSTCRGWWGERARRDGALPVKVVGVEGQREGHGHGRVRRVALPRRSHVRDTRTTRPQE